MKHLSTLRKRNQRDSLSSGERKGTSPNLLDVKDSSPCPKGVMGLSKMSGNILWSYKIKF